MMSVTFTIVGRLALAAALTPGGTDAQMADAIPTVDPAIADSIYPVRVSEGEVTLEIRPRWTAGELVLEIPADTHSVDLSTLNLQDAVRLVVEGEEVAPEEATSLGGHHGVARVSFPGTASPPSGFEIRIRGVPDIPERTLTWKPGA